MRPDYVANFLSSTRGQTFPAVAFVDVIVWRVEMTLIVIKHGEEAAWENVVVVVKVESFGNRDGPFQFDAFVQWRWGARRGDVRRLEGSGVTEHETGTGQRQKVAHVLALASRTKLQPKNYQFMCFSTSAQYKHITDESFSNILFSSRDIFRSARMFSS